jgi:hypothetical protein
MNNREFYEFAVLSGMLCYNDARPNGYLKTLNFRYTTIGVSNAKLFSIFVEKTDFVSRISEIRKLGDSIEIFSSLFNIKGAMIDFWGINTPKYCLLILESELKEAALSKIAVLADNADVYKDAVTHVYQHLSLGNDDFITIAENSMAYFKHIGFERGFLAFEELYLQFSERIKQINQNYEVQACVSKLRRYCDMSDNSNLFSYLEKIELELIR